jgi:protein-tyrosine phosphatase
VAHIIGDDMELKQKMQAFEGVNRSSAEYSLKTIKSRYADYGAYFEDVFGIDKEMRKKLQDKYLI